MQTKMDPRAERDAKFEELKRLKSKSKVQAPPVVSDDSTTLCPTPANLNPVLIKPEALPPIDTQTDVKRPVFAKKVNPPPQRIPVKPFQAPLNPFGQSALKEAKVGIQSIENPEKITQNVSVISSRPFEANRSTVSFIETSSIKDLEPVQPDFIETKDLWTNDEKSAIRSSNVQETLELDDLMIESLKKQLEVLDIAEKQLKSSTSKAQEENRRLKEEKENFDSNMENLRKVSEDLIKSLDQEYEKITQKMKKYEENHGLSNKNLISKEIQDLSDELDFFVLQSEEREGEIERLKKEIQKATDESKNLMIEGTHLSQPEPPPPLYNPMMESHTQMPRRLLSDMGSTGAWNNKKKKP